MKASHELITEARSAARNMPNIPGSIFGRKSAATVPKILSGSIWTSLLAK
jgi:hypothetical protein